MKALPKVGKRHPGGRVRLALQSLENRLVPAVINVDPSNYLSLVPTAQPGDTVAFAVGDYPFGLNLSGMNGTADAPITFDGSAGAVIQGTSGSNTVELDNTSYLIVENFTVDSRHFNDGIKAGGGLTNVSHDIQILDNTIINANSSQQTVGISTKCIAWNWVIEGNIIDGAGTGLYLGDSTGEAPFVNGLIDDNLIEDTIGYGAEIKDQNPYSLVPGMPTGPNTTIIRCNTFFDNDTQGPLGEGSRPNLFTGGFPDSGPGSADTYQIYGNLFDGNPSEALVQATSRASIHDNLFAGDSRYYAIRIQPHQSDDGYLFNPEQIAIYHNTIYAVPTGVSVSGATAAQVAIVGNLIFAGTPFRGITPSGPNLTDSIANASLYVVNPSTALDAMDFTPLPGQCQGPAVDLGAFAADVDYNLDLNGAIRPDRDTSYGAIEGAGSAPRSLAIPESGNARAGDRLVGLRRDIPGWDLALLPEDHLPSAPEQIVRGLGELAADAGRQVAGTNRIVGRGVALERCYRCGRSKAPNASSWS